MRGNARSPNARDVRLLALDVDGVLTDGGLHYLPGGQEAKVFHVRDGLAIRLAQAAGIVVAVLTVRRSEMVERRARELGVEEIHVGIAGKWSALAEILERRGIEPGEACYVGDDLVDLPVMERVGWSVAVADAAPEVLARADWRTRALGGHGAVREAVETILKARGEWEDVVGRYLAALESGAPYEGEDLFWKKVGHGEEA